MASQHSSTGIASPASILARIPIFDVCSEPNLHDLAAKSMIRYYEKGKVFFLSDDAADYFYIVVKGWVKLFRETLDGEQAVIDILSQDHVFGETSIFHNHEYPYSAEAVEDCTVLSIPTKALEQLIVANSEFALGMLQAMAKYRKHQEREIEHRSLQSAAQRIGCFLLRIAPQNAHGRINIHLPYDKTLIAARLGMQPETFSRALNKLRDETGIRINGASVEMDDIRHLSSFSCSACSSNFPCEDLSKND